MKRTIASAVLGVMVMLICSGSAQTPANPDEQALLALVKEVQAQQAEIVANQTKIEAKLAEVAEAVRVARIFAGRER
jgi:hypothetical protein